MSKERGKAIQVRVTDEEYDVIESKAVALGLNISNYVRLVAIHANLNITIEPRLNPQLTNKNGD